MVDGLVTFASPRFSSSWRRVHHQHHLPFPFSLTAPAICGSPSCQQQQMGSWANCSLKLASSSLFLLSSRKLLLAGEALKAQGSCGTISGFRVYSGLSSSLPPLKFRAGESVETVSAKDRLRSHFGLRTAAYRWGFAPLPGPIPPSRLIVLITTRSLKKESGGFEGEVVEHSSSRSRKRPAAPANKKYVRTIKATSNSSGKKSQQRGASTQEEGESASFAGRKSKRVSVKSRTQVSGVEKDEQFGSESSLDGYGPPAFRGVKASSSNQFGAKIVVVGSDIPKSKIPKRFEGGKVSEEPNSVRSRTFSGAVTTSASPSVSEFPQDLVGSKEVPVTSSSARMSSNHNSNRRNQATDESRAKQQAEKKPKKKDFPAEAVLRRDLNMCSKDGDVLRALDIYERSVAEGLVKWNQYNFNILLYLCSSAALGTLTARKSGTDRANVDRLNLKSTEQNSEGTVPVESTRSAEQQDGGTNGETISGEATTIPIVVSPEVMELAAQRGFEIFEDMKRHRIPPNEATLTAVARLAIKKEDGDLAFQMVKEMATQNIAPKLRSYSPALVTFCKQKAVGKAFEVDAHMLGAGLQPEEPELGALLEVCVELGLEKEVYSLLHRFRTRVRDLSPNTISAIEEWFSGKAGASAGEKDKQPEISALHQAMIAGGGGWHGLGWLGKGEWKLESTTIDSEGFCRSCKCKLVTIDLDPKETDNFAQSVAELAFARETKSTDFRRFQEWLERHGPFDAIIDGANVGLYNQNFQQGGFSFFQLNAVAQSALDQGLVSKPPLIILHHARTKFGAANSFLGQQLLTKWSSSNTLYTTPNGSNDDWYWMYAAVRNKCLLITNDEMRDHLFQLLGSDFFPKWKERHQVRFSATSRGPQFHLPPPYSLVIQECENGSWHFPKAGGNDVDAPYEWMCVTRPGSSSDDGALSVSGPVITPAPRDRQMEADQAAISPKFETLESDGISMSGSHPKRSRAHSPSTTLKKIRAADKQSYSGPVMFDI